MTVLPRNSHRSMSELFRSTARVIFARWSGVAFQKGDGIYGLRCPLAVIERYRSVEEKSYVAAEKTTRRLVRV